MKEHLFQAVETQRAALTAMADSIFDDPELGFQEFHAQKKLTDYLTQNGFQVEKCANHFLENEGNFSKTWYIIARK